MQVKNILQDLPRNLPDEVFEEIFQSASIRIERILSRGQASPESGWYDQEENEWVLVVKGAGRILFEDGGEVHLSAGDCLNIPRKTRHRVSWTDPDHVTVWLAIFYRE